MTVHRSIELAGSTLLIIGFGSVGAQVARLAKAFGMRVIAVNRTGRTDSPDVDEVRTSRFLDDLLPVSHSVVLTLPLTDETRGMLDARSRNEPLAGFSHGPLTSGLPTRSGRAGSGVA